MWTFCFSSQHSFSGRERERGFTLIELLISVAIIGIITGIVVLRFTSFDSTVLLKGVAYDIASSIRDAQVYAVSVVGTGGASSDYPYGMAFTPGTTYSFFRYNVSDPNSIPDHNDIISHVTDISVFSTGRTVQIKDLCVIIGVNTQCGLPGLDISFRRPEFHALFNVPGYTLAENKSIESATIKLNSTAGTMVWDVTVTLLGQISVKKE